jgi:hypothetical protein
VNESAVDAVSGIAHELLDSLTIQSPPGDREYASDTDLLSFVRDRGFEESRRFDWRGTELVIMERDLD